jgi:hypothetical protein
MTSSESNRLTIARALYVIAIMLIVIPLGDALPVLWPPHPGAANWRFGVIGILSGALMTPLLGTFLALAAAALLDHRLVLAVGQWLLFALVVVLVIATGLFALDFLEVRARIQEQARAAALGASAKAVWKLGIGGVVSLVLGVCARRMAKRLAHDRTAADQAPPVLVRPTSH